MKIESTLSFIFILLFANSIYGYNKENSCEKLIQNGNNLEAVDAAKKIKEIREKYMEAIRDLRSKITIAKKYA